MEDPGVTLSSWIYGKCVRWFFLEELDTEDAYKQKNLFYWLHQDGFYGETQLNQARSLVEE